MIKRDALNTWQALLDTQRGDWAYLLVTRAPQLSHLLALFAVAQAESDGSPRHQAVIEAIAYELNTSKNLAGAK